MQFLYLQFFLFFFFLPNIINANPDNPLLSGIIDIYNVVSSNLVPPDFLEEARKLGGDAAKFVNENIELLLASKDTSIAEGIQEFNATWTHIVTTVGDLHSMLNPDSLLERQGRVEDFATYFSTNMQKALEGLRAELEAPSSINQSECYTQQEVVINKILDVIEDVLVEACNFVNISHISEEQIREKFGQIKPHIRHAFIFIVCLAERHPYIARALLLTVVVLPLLHKFKAIRMLRIIVSLFGFGPAGPCKGSWAAWVQSYFFRGFTPPNSWFSLLQKVGMTWMC